MSTIDNVAALAEGWDLPDGIVARAIPASASRGTLVAIVREERYLDEDGRPRAASDVYVTDEGTQVEDVAPLPVVDGDGSVHAGDLLRVRTIESAADLDSLMEWAEGLEPSPGLDAQVEDWEAVAVRALERGIDEALEWGDVREEDPEDYGAEPVVWREGDGLHAAMWAMAPGGEDVVEILRDADGSTQRIE
jgi:hypothetical protein